MKANKNIQDRAKDAEDALLELLVAHNPTVPIDPIKFKNAITKTLDVLVATGRQDIIDKLTEVKAIIVTNRGN